MSEETRLTIVDAKDLKPGPIRHASLPDWFVVRARLVYHVVGDVCGMTLDSFLENFRRDVDPVRELAIWERIALAIAEVAARQPLTPAQKQSVYSTVLFASSGVPASELFVKDEGLPAPLIDAAIAAAQGAGFG